jgi:choline dehydrogenase
LTTPDYIVIGAGSAGCVLASRLSEQPDRRVLLLEAGGSDRSLDVRIPAAFPKLFTSERDWNYRTEPEPALDGRSVYCPRGKMLGGSSSMNAQIYARGNPLDYDEWAEAGNHGWAWDDVLPLFRRMERYADGPSPLRGTDGPLHVQALRDPHPLTAAALDAMAQHGIPAVTDYNGETQDGAGPVQVTQRRGRRWSAADAYLAPARRRSNLDVITGAHVTGIVVADGIARAVRFTDDLGDHEIAASREVILAGGAINSPQLLMLSGIGPSAVLREHGIDVVQNLPGVGRNLQDHPAIAFIATIDEPTSLLAAEAPRQLAAYILARKGMLTSNVAEAMAFVRLDDRAPAPDLQVIFAPVEYIDHGLQPPPGHGFTLGSIVLRPHSRGEVRLRSADPLAPPVIDGRYLSDPGGYDLGQLVAGLRLCRAIASQPALKAHVASELWPGEERLTDDELADHVRQQMFAIYHPVGTCRMGGDDDAVVDATLRVRGIDRLRVADASIMPLISRGNTNAPTIMIGERASDLIRSAT